MTQRPTFRAFLVVLATFAAFAAGPAGAAEAAQGWIVKQRNHLHSTEFVEIRPTGGAPATPQVLLRSLPEHLDEGPLRSDALYEEVWYQRNALPTNLWPAARAAEAEVLDARSGGVSIDAAWPGSEVRTLVLQGPTANRINLTIVGDGYTAAQKDRFFADAQRMTDDLFGQTTFGGYTPLFNVFAVFVPSRDSGITDTVRRDTALGLYRDPPQAKRAIMPGNTMAIERALALAPVRADYPILMANDEYYGGLGGRYAITTRSIESGAVVLRHELGHNFGNVGEEYDGGYVYSGANNSRTAGDTLKWKHWTDAHSRTQDVKFLAGEYVWRNLNGGPFRVPFLFPAAGPQGEYRFQVGISSVGWATPEDVRTSIDGTNYELVGHFTRDRSFFDLATSPQLAGGNHELEFRENLNDGDNVLAFAMVYAHAADYDFTPDQIGAYPVFNDSGQPAGYRSTHDSCLMRNMLTKKFCSPDLENMWVRFLDRVALIDDLLASTANVEVKTPPLKALSGGLQIRWFRVGGAAGAAGTEIAELRDRATWQPSPNDRGDFRVEVRFETPEVRRPTARFQATRAFRI
ncbi:MAG: hypothetical protein IT285_11590 [Bdellovibrionales bacterium]|nr:hypothetical protein [Bdellovibrionales bacterium]